MNDTDWIPLRLKEGILEGLGLENLPFPVRRARLGEIIGDGQVRFDSVLDELSHFVRAHPEVADHYRPALVNLSHVLAIHEGVEGRPAEAVRLLQLALEHAPDSARLRSCLALGQQLSGHAEEAVASYDAVLQAQGDEAFPLLTVLAAKAALESGDVSKGCKLLRGASPQMGRDAGFARLLAQFEARAQSEQDAQPTGPKFCRSCGVKLRPASRFCHGCGGATEPTGATL